ncbi:hypothetical protein LA52FAK_24160 [Desulforhopalus sp. 52FAK]
MIQYPLFQLQGGSVAERSACIDTIQHCSGLAHLDIGVARGNTYSRHDLVTMSGRYDLVLVDSEIDYSSHKISLGSEECSTGMALKYQRETTSMPGDFWDELQGKIKLLSNTPVWACILIGGKSSRMGQPKHLLEGIDRKHESWIEQTIHLVTPLVDGLVVSGKGDLPDSLIDVTRIPDIPGVKGPLTGVLSAMRWQPNKRWLVIACDMPFISKSAIEWLLSENAPGCWGRIPRLKGAKFCEPLFAVYDGRAAHLLEEQLLTGNLRVGKIAAHHKIDNPVIPGSLASAWQNVNTPEQLESARLS